VTAEFDHTTVERRRNAVAAYRKMTRRLRGLKFALGIRIGGGRVGRRLEVERGVSFRWGPHSGLSIGDDVRLCTGVIVDVPPGAELALENRVKVMHYTVIAAARSIRIGEEAQIAEHCSVRDADHGLDPLRPVGEQLVASPTTIGRRVWVGRGVAVLRGAAIGDDAVIGANSVVKGEISPGGIAVGSPARVVRLRAAPGNHTP
jgi:acetyltransferase-like isoleucine patch superfamily enzyme